MIPIQGKIIDGIEYYNLAETRYFLILNLGCS